MSRTIGDIDKCSILVLIWLFIRFANCSLVWLSSRWDWQLLLFSTMTTPHALAVSMFQWIKNSLAIRVDASTGSQPSSIARNVRESNLTTQCIAKATNHLETWETGITDKKQVLKTAFILRSYLGWIKYQYSATTDLQAGDIRRLIRLLECLVVNTTVVQHFRDRCSNEKEMLLPFFGVRSLKCDHLFHDPICYRQTYLGPIMGTSMEQKKQTILPFSKKNVLGK